MPIICHTCGCNGRHLSSHCPLDSLKECVRDREDPRYLALLGKVRGDCLVPVLQCLRQEFCDKDCHDVVVPDAVTNLLVLGRQHGPWQVPATEDVRVRLRGQPGHVAICIDYVSQRLNLGPSSWKYRSQDHHIQTHALPLDKTSERFFFSDEDTRRSNSKTCFKMAMAEPAPLAAEGIRAFKLLRFRRDGFREAIVTSSLGQECKESNTNIEPAWANGGLVIARPMILNPWSLKSITGDRQHRPGIFEAMKPYHVLIGEADVPRIEKALFDTLTYKNRPRFEVVDSFSLLDESLHEAMQDFSQALINGDDLNLKEFTHLIARCCRLKDRQGAHAILHEMHRRELSPNDVTLNCFVTSLYPTSAKRASKLMRRFMEQYNVKPTASSFKVVIQAFKKQRNLEEQIRWQREAASAYPDVFASSFD